MEEKDLQRDYELFCERCRAIIEDKYIMSDNNFIGLFRCIAGTPSLYDFLGKCNQGVDYARAFEEATRGYSFRLPASERKIVSLVSGMLFNASRGKLNINAFLMKYFPDEDIEVSFRLFCKSVIEPYMKAFGAMLEPAAAEEEFAEPAQDGETGDAVKEQVLPYLAAIREAIESDYTLKQETRGDYLCMADGLDYAFEMNNARLVKIVWIGLRSVMEHYRPVRSYLKAVEKLLVAYAVL